jgi:gluconate 2-dehydrogenase gamma chain
MTKARLNRRDVITAGAAFGTAVAAEALQPASARTIQGEMPWSPGAADNPRPAAPGAYEFLTADEAAFTEAAVARLIPADDLGPGAKEVGVPTFIDRQLAGPYGRAERWYMLGPWRSGTESQGYQSRLTPAQMFRYAIKAIDEHLHHTKAGKTFAQLSPGEQDSFLTDLENGKVELPAVSGKAFFDELLQVTVEGFFADPIYGGNRDMAAWKMIGFPGARYDYRDYISKHGERFPLPPVSLQGRPDWNPKG